MGRNTISFALPFVRIVFLCDLNGARHIFLGAGLGRGQRGACTARTADVRETWIKSAPAIVQRGCMGGSL